VTVGALRHLEYVQFRNDDAAGKSTSWCPTRENEVDRQDGEQTAVAELIVGAAGEKKAQCALTVYVQKTGHCQMTSEWDEHAVKWRQEERLNIHQT